MEYEALSYRWSDSSESYDVSVNGTPFSVSSNLYAALKRLRSAEESRFLWIDSICVNQMDINERNDQVKKMGIIFTSATCVRIWLGEEAENSNAAMKLASDISPNEADSAVMERVAHDVSGCNALTKLLGRSYWNRMWVYQEIVLANKATVHCGEFEAPWESFLRLEHLVGTPSLWAKAGLQDEWNVLSLRESLFKVAHFCIPRSEARHISNVLLPTRHLQATDPRDKLFALFGVCEAYGGMVPDYSRTTQSVYVDFTKSFMQANRSPSLLLTAGLWNSNNGPDIELPSWVPDFRGSSGVDIRYFAADCLKYYDAARGTLPEFTFKTEGGVEILEAAGLLISRITAHTPIDKSMGSRVELIKMLKAFTPLSGLSGEVLMELFHCLIFDDPTLHGGATDAERHRLEERYARLAMGFAHDIFEMQWNIWPARLQIPAFFSLLRARLKFKSETFFQGFTDSNRAILSDCRREYLIRSQETTNHTPASVFVTKDEGMLGVGLRGLQTGDLLVVLWGCRVPLIIREVSESTYRLVGPCYVDSLMNGQSTGKGATMRTFRLR